MLSVSTLPTSKHKPTGYRQQWNAKAKVGSLDNIDHKAGGGRTVQYEDRTLHWSAKAKVGSLDNIHYLPNAGRVSQTIPR